jgi:hypothetical protein
MRKQREMRDTKMLMITIKTPKTTKHYLSEEYARRQYSAAIREFGYGEVELTTEEV